MTGDGAGLGLFTDRYANWKQNKMRGVKGGKGKSGSGGGGVNVLQSSYSPMRVGSKTTNNGDDDDNDMKQVVTEVVLDELDLDNSF
jgi:hypothetical protein